ncbi:MAG: hypothetical protein ACRDVK_03420 [Acidimicrobiia bacterium]
MTETIRTPVQAFTTVGEDLVMSALSLWLVGGIVLDGWAHVTRGGVESFFTPWHAAFYSGFLAVAIWTLYLVRKSRPGPGVPIGYRLGLSGLVIFAAGGVGDLLWHQLLGIETSIDALISPTHLILLLGAMLIITSPIRSGWHRPTPRNSRWSWQAPALLSLALVAVLAQFFFLYASGWGQIAFRSDWRPGDDFGVALGMTSLVISTVIFMGLSLILLRRWDPPLGAFTMLVGALGLSMAAVHGFERPGEVIAALTGGVAMDWLARQLRPDPSRPTMTRAFGFLGPVAVWSAYVIYLAIIGDLRWPAVLWLGAVLMMGLWGLGLAILATPAETPGQASS